MVVSIRREGALVSLLGEPPGDALDGDRYVEALDRISAEREPYVLLVHIGIDLELTHEQRKAQNLWYKAGREQIEAACRACALVRPAADEAMQRVWKGLFGFPLLVTRNRDEAEAFLAPYRDDIAVRGHVPGEPTPGFPG